MLLRSTEPRGNPGSRRENNLLGRGVGGTRGAEAGAAIPRRANGGMRGPRGPGQPRSGAWDRSHATRPLVAASHREVAWLTLFERLTYLFVPAGAGFPDHGSPGSGRRVFAKKCGRPFCVPIFYPHPSQTAYWSVI